MKYIVLSVPCFRPLPFSAGPDDYGCRAPVSPLTMEPQPLKSWWGQQWVRSRHEAAVMDKFARENIPIDKKQFYEETLVLMQKELKKR